jgi:hypothetical protein
MTPLAEARCALCDLLLGRSLRFQARPFLNSALYLEEQGETPAFVIDDLVAQAAHMEWIAVRAEWGRIRYGGRFNRCGYQAEDDGEPEE